MSTSGYVSGSNGNDTINALAINGTSQTHVYSKAGNDTINLDFASITKFSHGHHVRGDGSGGPDDRSTNRGNDIFNFQNLHNVDAVVVGRIEDFDTSRDKLSIGGSEISTSELESGSGTTGGYSWRIVEYDADSRDNATGTQQWILIDTGQGYVFYALEGARTTDGSGASNTGDLEAHFIGASGGHQVTASELAALDTVGYVDPINTVPAGYTAQGGITINDDDHLYDADDSWQRTLDTINGTSSGDLIAAGLNNDTVEAGAGNDVVWGGSGDDSIIGNAGDDELYGGTGNDRMTGSDGYDLLFGGNGSDILFGGNGQDRIFGGSDRDSLYGENGNDSLYGQEGNDYLNGGGGNDFMQGGAGYDVMIGGFGADTMHGGDNPDDMQGGDGFDTIWGQQGNDTIHGGRGADVLIGGAGNDVFVFTAASDSLPTTSLRDTIQDFTHGVDKIDLSQIGTANQTFEFIGYGGFGRGSGSGGEVRINLGGGNTTVAVDVNGDGNADMHILLENATGITIDDFIL